ncbi:MAG TPA: hypothetical protein VFT63_05065, partial [bacterium]|nr:hypothetical protein [bacterium]
MQYLQYRPLAILLVVLGLFVVAVLVGYVGGQAFLSPTTSVPRPIRPTPQPAPQPAPRETPAPPAPLPEPQPGPQPS